MKKIILSVDGMTCSACSSGLEKFLNKQEGIIDATVNLVMANALIEYDETKLDIKQIETFIKKAGFKSLGIFKEEDRKSKRRNQKLKFIIFGILTIILLYISNSGVIVPFNILKSFNTRNHLILCYPYFIKLFSIKCVNLKYCIKHCFLL